MHLIVSFRGLCPQNYRNWEKCIQQKGEEHVYCTYYRALSEGGCGQKFVSVEDTVKPVLSSHSKRTPDWFSITIITLCRSKVLQNAPREAFCNTFDLH